MYLPPEAHRKSDDIAYNGETLDLFAAAILLFTMVTGNYPFV